MMAYQPVHRDREATEDFPAGVAAVVLSILAVTLLAWLIAASQPKRYRTETMASVSPIVNQLSDSEVLHGIDALERRVVVATVAALASSDSTRRRTIRGLRGGEYGIDATVVPSTNLIRISVEGPDPKQVAAIANSVPPVLDEQTRAMYRVYTIATVSAGVIPEAPFLPRVERAVMIGLILGALLGVAIAYLIDRRLRLGPSQSPDSRSWIHRLRRSPPRESNIRSPESEITSTVTPVARDGDEQ